MTDVLATIMYAIVVSREIVCILLNIALINALKVTVADIMNACITAPNKKDMEITWS